MDASPNLIPLAYTLPAGLRPSPWSHGRCASAHAASARPALANLFGTGKGTFGPGDLEAEFMLTHVNAPAAEHNAFVFEPQPLLHGGGTAQFDMAARAHDTVPGNGSMRRPEGPCYLPRVTRIAGGARHAAVGRDFAFRDFPDGDQQIAEHTLFTRQAPLPAPPGQPS